MKIEYILKVDRAELQRWHETASNEGLSTEDWIRRRCARDVPSLDKLRIAKHGYKPRYFDVP